MDKVKIGIIGCGKIVDCNHIPEIKTLGDKAEIVAMFDTREGFASAMADKHQLSPVICESEDELLACDIDAVIIATPNSFHYPQTIKALKAKKHVLVEKPMASRNEEADDMIDTAQENGVVLHVNQSIFYIPIYIEIKNIIDSGLIGKPLHIRSLRASSSSPDVGWSPGATWFVSKEFEGSLVTDIGIHMASMMEWFFGEVKQISAVSRNLKHEVPDHISATLDFANEATGSLELSWTFPVGRNALEIYGDDGYIIMAQDNSSFEVFNSKNRMIKRVLSCELPPYPNSHAEFLESIKLGRDSWKYGRDSLALCVAINKSNKSGKSVSPKRREK